MVIKLTENQSREPLYVTPAIKSLVIMSEGLLCGSFGEANQAGKTLSEDENSTWNF